jgi:hypothetical protein
MQISAECRWFTQSEVLAKALRDWFVRPVEGIEAGGGNEPRQDLYLIDPREPELGLKRRGSKPGVEIKGLVDTVRQPLTGPFNATIEIWSKWTFTQIDLDKARTISVDKIRRLRKFSTSGPAPVEIALGPDEQPLNNQRLPNHGCNVEFTTIRLPDAVWYSFGFESFGPLDKVEASLRETADLMAARNPPALNDAVEASYPKWLSTECLTKE